MFWWYNTYPKQWITGIGRYNYKLVCLDDEFRKCCKSYLGEDTVYNFINSMIEESKFYNNIMEKLFNQVILMTEEDYGDFENSTKC